MNEVSPELAFGVTIQVLPKPLFGSVLARTVRRRTDIPNVSATGADEAEAVQRVREALRLELDALKHELRARSEGASDTELRELLEQLLAIASAEGLRRVLQASS